MPAVGPAPQVRTYRAVCLGSAGAAYVTASDPLASAVASTVAGGTSPNCGGPTWTSILHGAPGAVDATTRPYMLWLMRTGVRVG